MTSLAEKVRSAFCSVGSRESRGVHTSMDAEYLVVDDDTQGQKVKHIREVMPDICIAVLPGALGIEAVGLCHSAGLVVSSDQMNSVGVS